ncbi:hypothetical protein L1049_007125 [Liquidambar formosana]|uniref:KIB1-4 beta-propeller domain-containing protein n=1 Tax=Liquidambar formosana TaxID=63359 RepID=A0AAP0N2Q1_LIQFO
MANWSELPGELLLLICQRLLSLSDQIHFSGVCSAWRSVGVECRCHLSRQIPGLMISSSEIYDKPCYFLRLPEARLYELAEFSVPHQIVCNGSTEGWMVVTDKFMQMHILNPFSGAQLQLPSVESLPPPFMVPEPKSMKYVKKAILSSNPVLNPDAFVLVIYSCGRLAFCKVGDETWTLVKSPPHQWHLDAIYLKGKFFSVCNFGTLLLVDIDQQPKVKEIASAPQSQSWTKRYLVEVEGELLLIEREVKRDVEYFSSTDEEDSDEDDEGDYDSEGYNSYEEEDDGDFDDYDDDDDEDDDFDGDEDDYDDFDDDDDDSDDENNYDDDGNDNTDDDGNDGSETDDNNDDTSVESDSGYDAEEFGIVTVSFKVYKLLSSEQKWTRVKSIGNFAVFLGSNSSFSLCTMDSPSLKGDCIYFTDDRITDETDEIDSQRGHDMGIYDLKNKTFEPLYPDSSELIQPPPFWPPFWITPIPW